MSWKYYLENDDMECVDIIERQAKPRMMMVVTHRGLKWRVWYIEQGAGVQNARCEMISE